MDDIILNQLKSDPEEGIISLMDTYMGLVYTIVKNKLCSACCREDIEECVSTVFYEFYRQIDTIDLNKGTIKSFLAVIAKRRSVDLYRQYNKGAAAKTASLDDNSFEGGSIHSPVDTETKHVLIQGIKDLGEPDSEIFIRKYYLGQSTLVISKMMGIKANTIDKKISRGLAKLKEALGGVLLNG